MDIRNIAAERAMAAERSQRARRSSAAVSAAFTIEDEAEAPKKAQSTSATMPMAGLDSLLQLQMIDDPMQKRKRTVQRGRTMLDLMDSLKIAVLAGRIPKETLHRIARTLRQREPSGDVVLEGIVAEIELRAAVELAKHGIAVL
jgi:ATP:corrinoid adenosyltransferase